MHPVMQQLISTKWDLFGKWASIFAAGFHFVYIMIWTWLAIFLPSDGKTFYKPISKYWWRLCLELLGCLMTLYFIAKVSSFIYYSFSYISYISSFIYYSFS